MHTLVQPLSRPTWAAQLPPASPTLWNNFDGHRLRLMRVLAGPASTPPLRRPAGQRRRRRASPGQADRGR